MESVTKDRPSPGLSVSRTTPKSEVPGGARPESTNKSVGNNLAAAGLGVPKGVPGPATRGVPNTVEKDAAAMWRFLPGQARFTQQTSKIKFFSIFKNRH
jgi:hypothetical protein